MNSNPKYPIYIISKRRWEKSLRLTSRALEEIDVNYRIVIEPQEYENYAEVIDKEKILVLPFSNLGQGSIPARNWVWERSVEAGAKRHWILDDNIRWFGMLYKNKKYRLDSGVTFKLIEEFVDRYENVALAGMQYESFVPTLKRVNPLTFNTRIYSCILILNELPFKWRGRYNEDTDLSLRVLKSNWCTILFNHYICKKSATMLMKGGNTDRLYKGDGRLKMAQSLQRQHPDIVDITWKWGRYQHRVNYQPFKGIKLKLKKGVKIPEKSPYKIKIINKETIECLDV